MDRLDDELWIELEQLPLYVLTEELDPEPPEPLPWPEAFRLLAPPPSSWRSVEFPRRYREQLWVDPVKRPATPWPEGTVRRLVHRSHPAAVGALRAVEVEHLAFDPTDRPSGPVTRWPGVLQVHRCGPAMHVDVVLEPWSRTRTDLRIEAGCRRGRQHLPRRYFDVAHSAVDALRDAVEAA